MLSLAFELTHIHSFFSVLILFRSSSCKFVSWISFSKSLDFVQIMCLFFLIHITLLDFSHIQWCTIICFSHQTNFTLFARFNKSKMSHFLSFSAACFSQNIALYPILWSLLSFIFCWSVFVVLLSFNTLNQTNKMSINSKTWCFMHTQIWYHINVYLNKLHVYTHTSLRSMASNDLK